MKLALLFMLCVVARTDPGESRVQATLSTDHTTISQPVQLEVEVRNVRTTEPPNVSAEGLSIRFVSQATRVQTLNGETSFSVNFSYVVTPQREGTFSIPPVKLNLNGKEIQSSPLTLVVVKEEGNKPAESNKSYFGELVVPKESAYVGEPVPVELRYYFDRRIWYQPYPQGQLPIIDGDGFVTTKYPDPAEKEVQVNGRWYRVLIYKTAITGVRAGQLDLHSATQEFLLHVPVLRNAPPGFDDYDQSPFGNGFSGYERKEVSIGTNGATLQIKPLPTDGRPANFSGAVGAFTMSSSIQPTHAGVGDPLDMQIQIAGNGNFDRVQAPTLATTSVWHVHQVTSEVEMQDDVGLNAIKTFHYPLVANTPVRESPAASFSYFDPEQEKYVTLTVEPKQISIEGQQLSQPNTQETPNASTQQTGPSPNPSSGLIDFVAKSETKASFQPLSQNPGFWLVQLLPAGILAGLGIGYCAKLRSRRRAPLRNLLADRRTQRRRLDSPEAEVALSAAVRLIQLDQLVRAKGELRHITVEDALERKKVPEDLRSGLNRLIEKRANCTYAHRAYTLSSTERSEIKDLIDAWEKAP
ncbi:MAG TPA: BatD family protein [Chthoniobacterales bacterium]|nr:BatD family protein [Chthoniobacterales bacterium]